MIGKIKVTCAYEVGWARSRAFVDILDGPHKGQHVDALICTKVADGDILYGEYDFEPSMMLPIRRFRPIPREG